MKRKSDAVFRPPCLEISEFLFDPGTSTSRFSLSVTITNTHPPFRYNNELWVLNLDELKWSVPALPTGGQAWPSARSGCQVSVHGDTMFVYGGYSKVMDHNTIGRGNVERVSA